MARAAGILALVGKLVVAGEAGGLPKLEDEPSHKHFDATLAGRRSVARS